MAKDTPYLALKYRANFMGETSVTEPTAWNGTPLGQRSSFINSLDARLRICTCVAFAGTVVFCSNLLALCTAFLIAFSFAVIAKLSLLRTLKRIFVMEIFVIFILLLLPFTVEGPVLFTLGEFNASITGALKATEIGLKANAIVITIMALIGTMETSTLGHALAHLKVPEKLVHLLLFTVRYLDVIGREYLRMRQAMKARAFIPRSNLHTWRTMGYMLGMLLVRSLERSERVLNAMKCRGYTGKLYLLDRMIFSASDYVFLGLNLIIVTTLIGINQL